MSDNRITLLLTDLKSLHVSCEQLAVGGNPNVRQMAAADARRIGKAIETIQNIEGGDPARVLATLDSLRLSGSHIRDSVLQLTHSWARLRSNSDSGPEELEEESLLERVVRDGELGTSRDWDSGGPGAGAGRVCVYRYAGSFYATHDAGLSGPFSSEAEACRSVGI